MFRILMTCVVASASVIACSTTAPTRPPADTSISAKRTYSQQDIERTGRTNLADALQMLDPSITVHH